MGNLITLYHNTTNNKAISISKQGIIAGLEVSKYGKGSEAEGSGVWCSTERGYGYGGATITFKIDIDDDALWKANDTEYVVYRDISLNEITDIDLVIASDIQCNPDRVDTMLTTVESDIPSAVSDWGKDELLKVFKENSHLFVEPYNYELLENLINKGNKYCMGNIYNKKTESKQYINSTNFKWNGSMQNDKPLFLEMVKEKVINGNKEYRDLYISNSYAFLAPDNYGADSVDEIEVNVDTQLEQASKEFDKICKKIKDQFVWACQETNQLDLIDNTTNWRVRDFISEAYYQSEQIDKEKNHRAFASWRRVCNIGQQILTDDMLCVTEHMSKYDKLN